MNHDDVRSGPRPSMLSHPGPGVNLRFLCPRCKKPSQQLGCKLRFFQGLRQRVCAACYAAMTAPAP